jgi:ABC-type dipeptide/oligopeptide/nickel transport system permease component
VFWTRYWQERAIDFRPAVVRRLVRRVADRPSLSGDDVLQLDTYALAEIADAFGTVSGPDDVARARRLGELASHATGLKWNVMAGASVEETRAVVTRWHSWWALYRSDYVTFDGPSRALAMITETQYGKWAAEAARNRLGIGADGKPVFDTLKERAKVTFWLVGSALWGGYALGVLIGLFAAGRARNPWRPHAARLRALPLDWLLSIAALLAAGVPVIALAAALAPSVAGRRTGLGAALCVAVAAALVSRHQRAASSTVLDQEYARTETAFGVSPFRTARRGFRAASTAAISLFGVDLPALITTAFVVERVLGLPGLGPRTFEAVSARDLSWLMAVAVLSALAVALAQILSDAVLAAVDPRVRIALERKRGAPE